MSMSPWWRIGWRNLGRNRRRTLITMGGLAFGYLAVVLLVAWMEGLTAEMIESATRTFSGQLQIHDLQYRPERKIYDTIGGREGTDVAALVKEVTADPVVTAAAPRVYAGGLVSSGEATTAGLLLGIDPELEPKVSNVLNAVVDGRSPRAGSDDIVVGAEMARQLAVGIGDEVILVVPAADGSMGNDLYTVAGIFNSGLAELDATYAMVSLQSLQTLLVLEPNRVHEIAASVTDPWLAPQAADRIAALLAVDELGIEVEPWTRLRPEMLDYAQLARAWNGVIIFIVFAIAIFGVANTMLMATYERRREIAVMLALGTTPLAVVRSVMAEALCLGAISIGIGALLTLPLMLWFYHAPPSLSWLYGDFTMLGALIKPVLRVEWNPGVWIWSGVALVMTTLVAALYPALRAARIPPADTLSGL
ncbi:MAG: ABC transporter permease [Gemmatimonadales bacterium]|jgi:ABC-type lipoprotein release transport system permease subunit